MSIEEINEEYLDYNNINYEDYDVRYAFGIKKRTNRDEKEVIKAMKPKIWEHWGKWSKCSVTCGVGKIIRWRFCISDNCGKNEREAQIKTCVLAPCL